MLFVFLFALSMLILPVIIDAQKHEGRNIFVRSGNEIVENARVQSGLRALRISAERVSSTAVSIVIFAVGLVLGILLLFAGMNILLTLISWIVRAIIR